MKLLGLFLQRTVVFNHKTTIQSRLIFYTKKDIYCQKVCGRFSSTLTPANPTHPQDGGD